MAFADAAQEAGSPKTGGIASVLSDLLTGGRVKRVHVDRALQEVLIGLGVVDEHGKFVPPANFSPPAGWPFPGRSPPQQQARGRMPPRQPQQPPQIDELELQRRRARQTLGFGAEPRTAEMVKQRRRELAKQHHPDAGGSAASMARINDAADLLLKAVAA